MPSLRENLAPAAAALDAAGIESPRLTAEVLLAAAIGRERPYLYAHPEEIAAPEAQARFHAWIEQRGMHVPLQQLTGVQEFYGRNFRVSPAALIPRPETELVVEAALDHLPPRGGPRPVRVADVGTGSGCIAVTLALERPDITVFATDIAAPALELARENARRLGARVEFFAGDLLTPLDGAAARRFLLGRSRWSLDGGLRWPATDARSAQGVSKLPRFDLIVSNPPYLAAAEVAGLAPEVREHEPRSALVAGPEGTEVYARLIPQAREQLRSGGWLVLELGYASAAPVRALLSDGGWQAVEIRKDWQGWERAVCARIN